MFFIISLPFILLTRKVKLIPLYILIFLVTISPYWIATSIQTGSWSLSQKASAQIKQGHAFQINKNATTWSQEAVSVKSPNYKSEYFKGGLSHVLEYSDWYWFWFKQKANIWKNELLKNFPVWSLPLFILGVSTIYLPFTLVVGTASTIFATPIADVRYLLWAYGLLLAFFFIGVKRLKLHVLIALAAIALFPSFNYQNVVSPISYAKDFTNSYFREEIKMAGAWLLLNSKISEPKIMMRHEGVEFYSNGETVYTPQDLNLVQTIDYARSKKANYVIAWKEELYADKNLSVLLEPLNKYDSLTSVFRYPENNPKIIVYEFSQTPP